MVSGDSASADQHTGGAVCTHNIHAIWQHHVYGISHVRLTGLRVVRVGGVMVQHEDEAIVGNAQGVVVVDEVPQQLVAPIVCCDHCVQPDAAATVRQESDRSLLIALHPYRLLTFTTSFSCRAQATSNLGC